MKIQFNTDKTISGEERNQNHFTAVIEEQLQRFESHITRIEVHLSDENGKKEALNDTKCLLEVRLENRNPVTVSCKADSDSLAISGACTKMKTSLTTIFGRLHDQEKHITAE